MTDKSENVAKHKEIFPNVIPTMEEMKEKITECNEMERITERLSLYEISDEDRSEYDKLETMFAKGIPTDDILEQKQEEAEMLLQIQREIALEHLTMTEKTRLDELEQRFAGDAGGVTVAVTKWNERSVKASALPANQATLSNLRASWERQTGQKARLAKMVLVLGLAVLVLGAVLFFMISRTPGIGIMITGVLLILAGLFLQADGSVDANFAV